MSEAAGNKRGLSEAAPNQAPGGEPAGAAAKPAAKKPRKKPVTAKSLGLTKDEYDRVKAAPIKKDLKAIVKTLARQVDADWHDGYEEQAETKGEWFEALEGPLQAVLDIGVGKRTALVQCNEILKIVADSYADLLACPCRCDVSTMGYLCQRISYSFVANAHISCTFLFRIASYHRPRTSCMTWTRNLSSTFPGEERSTQRVETRRNCGVTFGWRCCAFIPRWRVWTNLCYSGA